MDIKEFYSIEMKRGRHVCDIPDHTYEALERYVCDRMEPGSFLRSVLENNLSGAVGRADHLNLPALKNIVEFIYNFTPSPCWGSEEHVNCWLADDGLKTSLPPKRF